MFTRREVTGLVGGSMILTSGCLGFVTGEESYSETAEPARTDEDTADESGYELEAVREERIEEEFEIAGETRALEVGNWITVYEKTVDHPIVGEAESGIFSIVSTPAFEIAGRTLNPISDYDNEELVDLIASEYEGLEVRDEVGTDELAVQGDTVEVSKFDAVARFQGHEIDVFAHVGSFPNADDFLVPLGIYPQELADEEESNIVSLMEDIRHPAEA